MKIFNLKKILFPLIFIFCFTQYSFSQGELILSGRIKDAIDKTQYLEKGKVVVFSGTQIDTTVTVSMENDGKYRITFPLGKEYMIKFSCSQYTSKRITVNSKVPEGKKRDTKIWRSQLNITLYERIEGIDYSALNTAFAKIIFKKNSGEEHFSYDEAYHNKVKASFEKIGNEIKKEQARKASVKDEVENISDEAREKIIAQTPDKAEAVKMLKDATEQADSIKIAADSKAENIRAEAEKYKQETEKKVQSAVDSILTSLKYVEYDDPNAKARQIIFLAQQKANRIIADAERKAEDLLKEAGISAKKIPKLDPIQKKNLATIKDNFKRSGGDKSKQQNAIKKYEDFLSGKRMELAQERYYLELQKLKAKTREDSMLIEKREKEIFDAENELKAIEDELKEMREEMIRKDMQHEYEMKRSRDMLLSAFAVVIILLAFLVYIIFNYIKIKRLNRILDMQKQEIEEKNSKIMSSLTYARRIQEAFLPQSKIFEDYFNNSFILFMPKDVVSGDFYWIEKSTEKTFFSVVDCTGHGVPGAFMSIIGNFGLNKSLKELKIDDPGEILNSLSQLVSETLSSDGSDLAVKDGMDLALCTLNNDRTQIEFSGAYNPMYIIRKGDDPLEGENENQLVPTSKTATHSLYEVKPDKFPIGGLHRVGELYTTRKFNVKSGDIIYIFSDGYIDQFGGKLGKKFKFKPFRELLLSLQNQSMDKQQESLKKHLDEWMGTEYEQIDDICIMGVKI